MSPSQKAPAKPAPKTSRTVERARERYEENGRVIRRIADSLDVAQADLGKLRGSVGAGVGDLRRDLTKLLRDARRDATKMGKATRKDLERLQKDMVAAARAKPNGSAARKSRTPNTRARSRRAAH